MTTRIELLRLLADGGFHSGTDMGRALGVTRAAVCKGIKGLAAAGVEIHRVTGRGYRLAAPLAPLDERVIRKRLAAAGFEWRGRLEILEEVDSTNRYLLERAQDAASGHVCLAEAQPCGRGRRGRNWVTTPYHNLMLSLAWRFQSGPGMVAGLALAAGVALTRALEEYGVDDARLKWPNDVLWNGRKLAGLLADVEGEAAGPCRVVLGVGINGYIAERDGARIDQPWVDLQTITGASVDRNRLAALVIRQLARTCEKFGAHGFAPFQAEWERRHLYAGRPVRLMQGETVHRGTVAGIDDSGALLLRDAQGRTRAFYSGDISLRPAA